MRTNERMTMKIVGTALVCVALLIAPGASAQIFVINEILADPDPSLDGDANCDGVRDGSEDEFIELINTSGGPADISGWQIHDAVGLRHTIPAGTVIQDQHALVIFGGGTPSCVAWGATPVQTASTGFLGFNNTGDTVTFFQSDGSTTVATMTYGSEGGQDQSLNLNPDITGLTYVLHTTLSLELQSPGTLVDGTPLPVELMSFSVE